MNFDLHVRNKCYYPFSGKHASGNVFLADYGGTGSNANNGMSVLLVGVGDSPLVLPCFLSETTNHSPLLVPMPILC
jgi:hypothetical protein